MQPHKLDNSESDLLFSLSSSFDISPNLTSTEMTSMFSGSSPAFTHSRSISDSTPSFIQRNSAHPSPDLYKTNHTVGPLRREQTSYRLSISPPCANRTQRFPGSSTSNKRSRSHTCSDGDEETLDGPLPDDATEQEKIDWRRRQNTLAARKSRRRKQEHMQQLEEDVQRLSKEKDVWKERALMLKQLLISQGLPSPNFER